LVTGAGHVDGVHVPNVPDNVGEGARRPSPTPTPACRRAFTRRSIATPPIGDRYPSPAAWPRPQSPSAHPFGQPLCGFLSPHERRRGSQRPTAHPFGRPLRGLLSPHERRRGRLRRLRASLPPPSPASPQRNRLVSLAASSAPLGTPVRRAAPSAVTKNKIR